MALQKSMTLDSGIVLPEAYIRVESLKFNPTVDAISINVLTYKDKSARDGGLNPIKQESYLSNIQDGVKYANAEYRLELNQNYSGKTLRIDLDNDGTDDVTIQEGVDFVAPNTTFEDYLQSVVDTLNTYPVISDNFTLTVVYDYIKMEAKQTGIYSGSLGNSVKFLGDMVLNGFIGTKGEDEVASGFETFFSYADLDKEGNNIVGQSYKFLLSKDEFKDCVSV